MQRICKAHDTVMRSCYQQMHGSSGADAMTSMENITGQSLSKMSKPTALHTEGTAQVSEWLNISDTTKKLY